MFFLSILSFRFLCINYGELACGGGHLQLCLSSPGVAVSSERVVCPTAINRLELIPSKATHSTCPLRVTRLICPLHDFYVIISVLLLLMLTVWPFGLLQKIFKKLKKVINKSGRETKIISLHLDLLCKLWELDYDINRLYIWLSNQPFTCKILQNTL